MRIYLLLLKIEIGEVKFANRMVAALGRNECAVVKSVFITVTIISIELLKFVGRRISLYYRRSAILLPLNLGTYFFEG